LKPPVSIRKLNGPLNPTTLACRKGVVTISEEKTGVGETARNIAVTKAVVWVATSPVGWFTALTTAVCVLLAALVMAAGGHQAEAAPCGNTVRGGDPTQLAHDDVPADYLQYAHDTEEKTNIPWNVLMGISKIESNFGRLVAPGVKSGSNFAGAAGPMQIGIGGAAGNTWGGTPRHRVEDHAGGVASDANGDGWEDVYDPADAILAAAKYLKSNGAPADLHRAIFAYNHAEWYVAQVMNNAHSYAQGNFDFDTSAATKSPDSPASAPTGSVYVLGDSIALGAKQQLIDALGSAYSGVYVNASRSRSITTPGDTPGNQTNGIQAVLEDTNKESGDFQGVAHASTIIVELGTNDLTGGSAFEARIRQLVGAIQDINNSATIYWVEVFADEKSNVDKGSLNTSIEKEANAGGTKQYELIKPAGQNIDLGSDGVHPTGEGDKKFAQLVASQVGSSDPGSTAGCAPAGSGNLPPGDAQDLAKAILTNPKIVTGGRLVYFDLHQQATGGMPSNGVALKSSLLSALSYIGQSLKVDISALESGGTGHTAGSAHYDGRAMDIAVINGVATTGRDANALAVLKLILPVLPAGSSIGQQGCGPGPDPSLPAGIGQFSDTCNHLHIQVPG
jgi:lysophospholipase L1-like esterase